MTIYNIFGYISTISSQILIMVWIQSWSLFHSIDKIQQTQFTKPNIQNLIYWTKIFHWGIMFWHNVGADKPCPRSSSCEARISFEPNEIPNIFSSILLWNSMKAIFGGRKQSKGKSKGFYFNRSLTLKTKSCHNCTLFDLADFLIMIIIWNIIR